MVSLVVIFWMYVILFAIIGAMRGWARELLVSFAVVLGLFMIKVVVDFVPFVKSVLEASPVIGFWIRTMIILGLVFFGYQTPNIQKFTSPNKFARDRLQDMLLGIFLGALNGYMIVGSIWYYLHSTDYPFPNIIEHPTGGVLEMTVNMMKSMPPELLMVSNPSAIYFAVALAFAFVLVVFI